jgi:histidine decarboxylase
MMKRLEEFLEKIKVRSQTYIGYPAGIDYDYKELYPLLDYSLNNVGDPLIFMLTTSMHQKTTIGDM